MHFTSRFPIPNIECIVRTKEGKVFPAAFQSGRWVSTLTNTILHNVTHWIVYPVIDNIASNHESLNESVPDEIIMRYLVRDYRAALQAMGKKDSLIRKQQGSINSLHAELNELRKLKEKHIAKKEAWKKMMEDREERIVELKEKIKEQADYLAHAENKLRIAEAKIESLQAQLYANNL